MVASNTADAATRRARTPRVRDPRATVSPPGARDSKRLMSPWGIMDGSLFIASFPYWLVPGARGCRLLEDLLQVVARLERVLHRRDLAQIIGVRRTEADRLEHLGDLALRERIA